MTDNRYLEEQFRTLTLELSIMLLHLSRGQLSMTSHNIMELQRLWEKLRDTTLELAHAQIEHNRGKPLRSVQ